MYAKTKCLVTCSRLTELAGGTIRIWIQDSHTVILPSHQLQGLRLLPFLLLWATWDFEEGVILGKFLNFSEFWSTYLQNEANNTCLKNIYKDWRK